MKTIYTILVVIFVFTYFDLEAQVNVLSNGNVGIQTTSPASKLSIGDVGNSYSKVYIYNADQSQSQRALQVYKSYSPGGIWSYGIYSSIQYGSADGILVGLFSSAYRGPTATNYGQSCGIYGQAGNAKNGLNVALHGELVGERFGTAVLGRIPGRGGIKESDNSQYWAGYFRGAVYIEDILTVNEIDYPSDINFKKDIRNLENGNLEKIITLNAIKYKLKSDFELNSQGKSGMDTISQETIYSDLNNPVYNKDRIGISAQEIQKVYPELVRTTDEGRLFVNYIGLIPVLIESIKEQQTQIETLQQVVVLHEEELINLKKQMSELTNIDSKTKNTESINPPEVLTAGQSTLYQNTPNPFTVDTRIEYYIPDEVSAAKIIIHNLNGKELKILDITSKGSGSITIHGSELEPGMYLYTLVADKSIIDTKRMILTNP